MKQTILTIFFAIISMVAKTQPCINSEANAAKVGDRYTVSQIAYINAGRKGENVLWNMSGVKETGNSHKIRCIGARDTAKFAVVNDKTTLVYEQHGDTLLQTGSKSRLTSVAYDVPIVQLRYPVHYGDTIGGLYGGYGTYANSMRFVECGWYGSKADSYGTLITPDSDTLRNVLRIQSERYVLNSIVPSDAGDTLPRLTPDSIRRYIRDGECKLKIVTTEWYAEGYRYPVVTTVLTNVGIDGGNSMAAAYYYSPASQMGLNDEVNETIRAEHKIYGGGSEFGIDKAASGFGYNVYAYDDGTGIRVEYSLQRTAVVSATVATVGGISLYSMPQRKQEANVYSFDIKADGIGKSAILLNFFVDGKVYQEKIVLK
jgi:hypothetical protein